MLATLLFNIALAAEPLEVPEDTVIDGVPVQRGHVEVDDEGALKEATLGATVWVGGLQLEAGTHWVRNEADVWTVDNEDGIQAWTVRLKGPVQLVWQDDVPVRVQGSLSADAVVDGQALRGGHPVVFTCMDTSCVHVAIDAPKQVSAPAAKRRVEAPAPAAAREP